MSEETKFMLLDEDDLAEIEENIDNTDPRKKGLHESDVTEEDDIDEDKEEDDEEEDEDEDEDEEDDDASWDTDEEDDEKE